jgi:uncharacterized protein (TIGR02145 family)
MKKLFLSMALSSLVVIAFAQGAEVCEGTGYTIADAVPASAGSEYRWTENGNVLPNTNAANYNVPNNKTTGVYTYVRQSKSAECPDWQSSNEFTVTVFACSFTAGTETGATATFRDPRDGKPYKTVVLPDGRTWFAQNLNYTKDLTFNKYAYEANGKQYTTSTVNGAPAIGSYWCPGADGSIYSGDQNMCNIYGAFYTWETAMMVDGKYADESKTSSAWDESWVSPYYYNPNTPINTAPNADKNSGRGGTNAKGGGRGICPMGWHVPTILEIATMLDAVDGDGSGSVFVQSVMSYPTGLGTDVAVKLMSAATYTGQNPYDGSWDSPSFIPLDVWGFRLLPTGLREYGTTRNPPYNYRGIGSFTHMFSSSATTGGSPMYFFFNKGQKGASSAHAGGNAAVSYRCIKD